VLSYGGKLPRNVVIALGTNGTVSLSACRAVVRTAGPARRVFLVTNRVPRSWQNSNNATLRACDRSFSARRVHVIDWHAASAGHPGWFAADRIHPSGPGRVAFARLIDRAVDRYGR
jgi:lysophospholipase L1-like esterase